MHSRQRRGSSIGKMKTIQHATQKIITQGKNLANKDENKTSEVT